MGKKKTPWVLMGTQWVPTSSLRMTLLPLEEMDTSRPIIQYGVDSLLAAEYRHWLWSSLKVDVPFLSLTKGDMNLTVLAHDVASKLPYVRNESI